MRRYCSCQELPGKNYRTFLESNFSFFLSRRNIDHVAHSEVAIFMLKNPEIRQNQNHYSLIARDGISIQKITWIQILFMWYLESNFSFRIICCSCSQPKIVCSNEIEITLIAQTICYSCLQLKTFSATELKQSFKLPVFLCWTNHFQRKTVKEYLDRVRSRLWINKNDPGHTWIEIIYFILLTVNFLYQNWKIYLVHIVYLKVDLQINEKMQQKVIDQKSHEKWSKWFLIIEFGSTTWYVA